MSVKVGPTHKKSPCPTSGVRPKVVVVNLEMLEGSARTAASERRAPASGSREAAGQQQEHLEPQQRPAEGSPGASAHLQRAESSCGSGPPLALPAPPSRPHLLLGHPAAGLQGSGVAARMVVFAEDGAVDVVEAVAGQQAVPAGGAGEALEGNSRSAAGQQPVTCVWPGWGSP